MEGAMQLFDMRHDVFNDAVDAEIARKKIAAFNKVSGPRVGDFVLMEDGTVERTAHDWGEQIQTTDGKFGSSFYLSDGSASFSGGLNRSLQRELLSETTETREGVFWFFHHNEIRASNAVGIKFPCRVYEMRRKGDKHGNGCK